MQAELYFNGLFALVWPAIAVPEKGFDHQCGGTVVARVIGMMTNGFRSQKGLASGTSPSGVASIKQRSSAVQHPGTVLIVIGAGSDPMSQ